jgi:hypothetical protein
MAGFSPYLPVRLAAADVNSRRPSEQRRTIGTMNQSSRTSRESRPLVPRLIRAWLAALAAGPAAAGAHDAKTPPGFDAPPLRLAHVTRMDPVIVRGRADDLVGVADTASVGVVGADQIGQRPLLRPGEVLETVPGVIITQHSGAGKANQYFLRGFNLDHGTDFATSVNGVPVNLPTHGHGQGYSDLNFIIPELIRTVSYRKGPYYADEGDFSSAGAANLEYYDVLPGGIARAEGGSFGYARGVLADTHHAGPGHLLYGLELFHNDGPWVDKDDYRKVNGVLRYSQGDASEGFSVIASGYAGDWDATDQVARRAVDAPGFGRFDTLDTTTGGESQRYQVSAERHRRDAQSASEVMAYGFYYDLDLWSNFTYFLDDPVNGDQFLQRDKRWVAGAKARHTWFHELFGREAETAVGLQVRNDWIDNGLFKTAARRTLSTTRADDITQTSLGPWVESRVRWGEKFRSVVGVRADYYRFDVDSDNPVNSGTEGDFIASPKGRLVFGPWNKTEFYISGGLGFHSNDGRGTTTRVDPGTGLPVDRVDPLVRTYGAEVGVRTTAVEGLQSTLAFWWLDIDSELLFIGDAGTTEASRPSRRYGVEFANFYSPTKWLTFDADFSFSHARFRNDDPAGDHIPGSIESVIAAGVTVHNLGGFFASLRLRYFGARPLIEDDSVRSNETILLSAEAGYRFNPRWTLSVEAFNLLNRKDSDIDYFYESRLAGEGAGVEDVHFHPVDPISFRVALTARF